jgi:serine/threonine-protein kinase
VNLLPGQILAEKYRIIRQIGQGGMGAVFEGENVRIRRRVAIKTLHAAVSMKEDVIQRFEREAQAAGRIGSEHIVEVLDMGELPDSTRYMVMEFLEGQTLGERIVKQGRIAPRDMVPIMDQLLEGLEAAHKAGIIHRDLKPANVFLCSGRGGATDFVKILDFGVSKFNVLNDEEMSMTRTGAVVGTPYYMSPEQAKGARSIDHRADLYSVGVMLYEAITGQVPFSAETFNELIFKIALESPPPPEQFVPNLDPAFSALLRRAMSRDVGERFQSAAELRSALVGWERGAPAPVTTQPSTATQVLALPGPRGPALSGGTVAMSAPPAHSGRVVSGGTLAMGPAQAPVAGPRPGPPPTSPQLGADTLAVTRVVAPKLNIWLFVVVFLGSLLLGGAAFVLYAFTGPPSKPTIGTATARSTAEPAPDTTAAPTSAAEPTPPGASAEPTALPPTTASALVLDGTTAPSTTATGPLPTSAIGPARPTGTSPRPTGTPTATVTTPPTPTGRPIDDTL